MRFLILFTLVITSGQVLANCLDPSTCLEEIEKIVKKGVETDCHQYTNNASDIEETQEALEVDVPARPRVTFDRSSWKYALAGITAAPVGFGVGVALHEGTHCIAANIIEETECGEVILFPYYDKEFDYFYFGSTMVHEHSDNPASARDHAIIDGTPMVLNASLISLYSTLAFTNKLPKNKWLKTGALVLGASQVVDLANHAGNAHPYSDSGKLISFFQSEHTMNPTQAHWSVKGPQIAFVTIGASAVGLELFRILTKPADPVERTGFNVRLTPSIGPGSANIGLSGQF